MNRVYRLIWSHVAGGWVAVAESARGRGKGAARKIIAAALLLAAAGAQAAPAGGQVTSGVGSVAQSGVTTTINQTSQNLSLNWQSFNVGSQEAVNFVQPSASAIAVNRILDTNGSQIMGRINANGQVFLTNPNGILFGSGSQVNVGGLVASTLNIQDASLNSSTRAFSGNGPGSIVNLGTINAASGGYVALLGNQVSNQGSIVAELGTVALGGGSAVTLNFNGNSLVNMVVDQSVLNSLAENGGLIKADGGMVVMSAGAKDSLLASVVNNTGAIEAQTMVRHEGKITLLGGMAAGTVNVAGTLNASAPNGGNGGFIETSAARVAVADTAKISTAAPSGLTGTWLVDPTDFTIAASGGDMTGAAVSAALANNNFSVQSTAGTVGGISGSGDVNVNDVVAWNANKLTLSAQNNININARLNGTASASLAIEYGQGAIALNNTGDYIVNAAVSLAAGDNLSTKLGSDGVAKVYTVVTDLGQLSDASVASSGPLTLQGMALSTNLGRNFALGSDINASKTANASDWGSAAGFTSIGTVAGAFTGTFAGLGHTVSDLTINRPGIADIGLIGAAIGNSVIRDVGLVRGSVTGGAGTGGLLGSNTTGSVSNSYNTANITGGAGTGGLVGSNTTGSISNSYSTGNVSGGAGTGGLIGASTTGNISNSYATGSVTGGAGTGGLIGANTTGNISNSYATGVVTGGAGTGGLMGASTTGSISNSYATGEVIGLVAAVVSAGSGGLVGAMTTGNISDSYATGNVSGGAGSGGLIGALTTGKIMDSYATGNIVGTAGSGGLAGTTTGAIDSSYATGNVSGHAGSGGLAGTSTGTVNLSYATGNVSGHAGSGGLAGTTTGAISSSYATGSVTGAAGTGGLAGTTTGNITTSYAIGNVNGAAGGTGSLAGTSTGNINNSYATGTTNGGGLAGTLTGINNGSYAVSAGDTIDFENFKTSGAWTLINGQPVLTSLIKTFTITANNVTQTYNGLSFSGGDGVSYSNPYQSYLTGTLSYRGLSQGARNAGTYDITAGGLSSTNAQYVVSYVSGKLKITARALTVTAAGTDKVYDGNTAAVVALGDNRVLNDALTLGNSTAVFGDKNAETNKTINVNGITLSGQDAGNYTFNTTAATAANISRLNSVTWIGGATGNWFDAANWQGGAVPDLSNVANVSIPNGVNVTFNNANASSLAQAGLVQVDSIGNLGALSVAQGNLNVANNLTLTALTQSGGSLGGNGNVTVNQFSQTGGAITNTGNFSVENAFQQTATGAIAVGGNIGLTQLVGDLNTSSLSGNNIDLTANRGAASLGTINAKGVLTVNAKNNITQTAISTLITGNGSMLTSSNGNIVLPNIGNDQGGTISASAVNITLADATSPTIVLNATGNTSLVSGVSLVVSGNTNNLTTNSLNGTTSFGATTISGDLSTASKGSVIQTSPVTVRGSASINTDGLDLTTIMKGNAATAADQAQAAITEAAAATQKLIAESALATSTVAAGISASLASIFGSSGAISSGTTPNATASADNQKEETAEATATGDKIASPAQK